MSETEPGDRTTCAVCGRPLEDNLTGWRHSLFCSIECEQQAARWQIQQISSVSGHQSSARPTGAGSSGAPGKKAKPRHADSKATGKTKPH